MIIPEKLEEGDEVRVIAPARSLSLISEDSVELAENRLEDEGFNVSFSKNCRESDVFSSSPVKSRVNDIHEAFKDESVKALLTVIGGFNSNQLLNYLDYDLIRENPKILCGYSDVTALLNAVFAKTGLVTYSSPHFSTWGMKKNFEYSRVYFRKCLTTDEEYAVEPSKVWSDDKWYKDQENRRFEQNKGYWVLNEGEVEGGIIGGNLSTFSLLHGTSYMPGLSDKILLLEDDAFTKGCDAETFDRNLQSLIHQPGFGNLKTLLIGRFQKGSEISREELEFIINTKEELRNIPVVANLDFGHTNPMFTFPIGGTAELEVGEEVSFKIIKH